MECFMVWLQAHNAKLQLGRARVSEADLAELQAECEARLGKAERRVFALQKERDAARAAAAAAPAPAALAERDAALRQVRSVQASCADLMPYQSTWQQQHLPCAFFAL
jgi:hypothetical protein